MQARARGSVRNAFVSSVLSLTRMRIPLASWLLVRSRSSLVSHLLVLLILSHIICGLRGHGEPHVVTASVPFLLNLTVPGSCLPSTRLAQLVFKNAGAIPICQFLVHLSLVGSTFSQLGASLQFLPCSRLLFWSHLSVCSVSRHFRSLVFWVLHVVVRMFASCLGRLCLFLVPWVSLVVSLLFVCCP